MTTKPGRFWFDVPSPYSTQEPMLGRSFCWSPQLSSIRDGSWFGTLACMERMMQRSSTCFATWGKISLTSMPLWPCFWNLNGER